MQKVNLQTPAICILCLFDNLCISYIHKFNSREKSEETPRTLSSPTAFAFALAKLPPDMNRLILEFKLGVVVQR